MEIVALAIALLALLSTWSARSKLASLSDELARIKSASPAAGDDDLAQRVDMNSRFLARLAAGESLMPDQIRQGQLWSEVSPQQAQALVADGVRLIDVRTPNETAAGIIPGAILIPVDELPQRIGELTRDNATTLIYCAMGVRSAAACQYLSEQGFEGLINLEGGFGRWNGEKVRP